MGNKKKLTPEQTQWNEFYDCKFCDSKKDHLMRCVADIYATKENRIILENVLNDITDKVSNLGMDKSVVYNTAIEDVLEILKSYKV